MSFRGWAEQMRKSRVVEARLAALEAGGGGGGGGSPAWSAVTGKPTAFPPEARTHGIGDVTGLQSALDGKASTSQLPGPNFDGYTQMVPAAGAFVANSANATALGTQAQVANRTIIAPFVPAYAMTIDQLGVSVSTLLAGANAKAVIFASDSLGRPTTLLRETGNISAAANATVFAAITSLALSAGGTYWVGIRASGTFTLRTLAAGALPALSYSNAATPAASQTLIRTETFADAAGNWTYALGQHSTALMPLVLMRVA